MKIKSLFTIAVAATTLFSCSKDENGPEINTPEGEKTFAQIELNLANNNSTRATFDGSFAGLATERAIDNVRLYMFNAVGVLEATADFGTGTSTHTFEATTGSKSFIALVNMGTNYPTVALNTTSIATFLDEVAATANLADIAKAGEFWMSNSTPVTATLAEWDGTGVAPVTNDVAITVARMVAKVGVEFAPTTQIDGSLTAASVEYKINNNPRQTRLFSKRDAGFLVTPFYDQAYAAGNYWAEAATAYKTTSVGAVNAGEFDATSVGYMLENSNETPMAGNGTYAVIRGQWVPEATNIFDGTDGTTPATLPASGDFYRVRHKVTGLYQAKYFDSDPVASGVFANTDYDAILYTGGIAYYAMYLNDTESNLPAQDKYVIERNTQWSVTITSVSGCGGNSEGELPGIIDPTDPLDVDAFMTATITVAPWVDRGQQGGI